MGPGQFVSQLWLFLAVLWCKVDARCMDSPHMSAHSWNAHSPKNYTDAFYSAKPHCALYSSNDKSFKQIKTPSKAACNLIYLKKQIDICQCRKSVNLFVTNTVKQSLTKYHVLHLILLFNTLKYWDQPKVTTCCRVHFRPWLGGTISPFPFPTTISPHSASCLASHAGPSERMGIWPLLVKERGMQPSVSLQGNCSFPAEHSCECWQSSD